MEGQAERSGRDDRSLAFHKYLAALEAIDIGLSAVASDVEGTDIHQKYTEFLRVVRQTRNGLASIHKLPNEVLAAIFSHFVLTELDPFSFDRFDSEYFHRIATLSRVSKLWHQIVHSSTRLWTKIQLTDNLAAVKLALAKSRSSPLTVTNHPAFNTTVPAQDGWTFFQEAHSHVHRWASADLWVDAQMLDALELAPAPKLECLRLGATLWLHEGEIRPRDLFQGEAPNLADVSIVSAPMNWDSKIFTGLQSLRLTQTSHHPPSLTQFLQILRNSPNLETLVLDDARTTTDDRPSGRQPTIQMAHLQNISILRASLQTSIDILSSLSFPNCTTIDLGVRSLDPINAEEFKPCGALLAPCLGQPWSEGGHLHIGGFKDSVDTWTPKRRVKITGVDPEIVLDWLGDRTRSFEQSVMVELHLWKELLGPQTLYGRALYDVLDKFRGISSLGIDFNSRADGVIKYLTWPRLVQGTMRWPMETLSQLCVHGEYTDGQLILDMVRNRRSGGPDQCELSPASFSSISLSNSGEMNLAMYQKIRKAVGSRGHVHWEGLKEQDRGCRLGGL